MGRERPADPGATAAAREASANAVFKAMGYDRGGWLPPGLSLTHNATGRPEPILSGHQWDMLAQAATAETAYRSAAGPWPSAWIA